MRHLFLRFKTFSSCLTCKHEVMSMKVLFRNGVVPQSTHESAHLGICVLEAPRIVDGILGKPAFLFKWHLCCYFIACLLLAALVSVHQALHL